MYDPFIDSFNEEKPLQTPLAPSRSSTPAVVALASDGKIDPVASEDAAALFDPLGFIPTNSRITQAPATAATSRATPKAAYDPNAQPKRRPGMLTISTPTNPPQFVGDPLEDLLGTRNKDDAGTNSNARPKPTRPFSTTPLFQPPPITLKHSPAPPPSSFSRPFSTTPLFQPPPITLKHSPAPPPSSFSRPVPHTRGTSDDFGAFVSVPPLLDPLSSDTPSLPLTSSHSAEASSGSDQQQPNTATRITNEFTMGARQRHAENANRILGEFARSEEGVGGDFLGWLDDAEQQADGTEDVENRERRLKMEEGPPSPPATPTYGPPPTTRVPKKKVTSPGQLTPVAESGRRGESSSRERRDPTQTVGEGGVGSYFPPSLPRRLTTLLSNASIATTQMSPSTHYPVGEPDGDVEDPHGILAMPVSSSIARLSSIPPAPGHKPRSSAEEPSTGSYHGLSKSATLPSSISSEFGSARQARAIPDAFLTHRTPFSTVKYVPPSGAPGYTGEDGWDTGGFAADWEGEGVGSEGAVKKEVEMKRKRAVRVMKLVERKEETTGVLTRGLSDALRLHLPALARLCTSWTLLYSMDQHGISLHTFYNLSSPSASSTNKVSGGRKGAILVIRDAFDGVFGAWIGEGLRMHSTGEGHFGGGDSFLWKTSSIIPDPAAETGEDDLPELDIFRWTGRNDYVALCEPDSVSLGGGEDGKTGIYLAQSLLDGSSAKCMTFDNDVLCAEDEEEESANGMGVPKLEGRTAKFEIIGLEVWGLVAS